MPLISRYRCSANHLIDLNQTPSRFFTRCPDVIFTQEQLVEFERTYETVTTSAPPRVVTDTGGFPKYQFLDFLVEKKGLLLHGSTRFDLTVLDGVRKSTESGAGFGSRGGSFAASDGIWAMFFAITDRRPERWNGNGHRMMGTSNGVVKVRAADGTIKRFGFFTLSDWVLAENPWVNGGVYAVPRTGFVADPTSEQWTSDLEAAPLFRVDVSPSDFPCLAQVWGHSAAEFEERVQLSNLIGRLLVPRAVAAEETDGYTLSYPADPVIETHARAFADLLPRFTEDIAAEVTAETDGRTLLTIRGRGDMKLLIGRLLGILPGTWVDLGDQVTSGT